MEGFVNGALVVLAIGFLIFVHELGHFLVAKKVGIRVEAFSLGFGPKIWGFFRGGTDYKICAIPLGGYVKMAGEYPGEHSEAPVGDEFFAKSISQRAWVVSAGVIMNVIFAMIAFPIAFSLGVKFVSAEIGDVLPGSPAWKAGLREGDEVVSIDDNEVLDFTDIQMTVAFDSSPVEFEVLRDGQKVRRSVTPSYDEERGLHTIGVGPKQILRFLPEPAKKLGVDAQDEIVTIGGMPARYGLLYYQSAGRAGTTVKVDLKSATTGEIRSLSMLLEPDTEVNDGPWALGLVPHQLQVAEIQSLRGGDATQQLGLRDGDIIVAVGGTRVWSGEQFHAAWFNQDLAAPLTLTVARSEEEGGLRTERVLGPVTLQPSERQALVSSLRFQLAALSVTVVPGSPAAKAGLQDGDRILQIGSQSLNGPDANEDWDRLVEAVRNSEGKALTLVVDRADVGQLTVSVTPEVREENLTLANAVVRDNERVERHIPFPKSLKAGTRQAWMQIKKILLTLRSFVMGGISPKNMGGIITIAQATYHHTESLGRLIFFMGFLSLNLAILNILPIPVLDGGHLVFLLLEKIKGGPISDRAMTYATVMGLVFLLGLMVFVTFNDIQRLLS